MASPLILVASATATTGSQAVAALSRAGARVRAFVRKLDDPRAKALAALPSLDELRARLVGRSKDSTPSGLGYSMRSCFQAGSVAPASPPACPPLSVQGSRPPSR